MTILDIVHVYGHKNIQCTHKTTIEITKDNYLTKAGNCILGIRASKACSDLNLNLKTYIKNGKKLMIIIKSGRIFDSFYGYGNAKLTLANSKDIVFRKSNYFCDRTVLINCNKSSFDLSRELINNLKKNNNKFDIIFKYSKEDEK